MLLVFDFDGTLCDSIPMFYQIGLEYATSHHLVPVTLDESRTLGLVGILHRYRIPRYKIPSIALQTRRRQNQLYPNTLAFPNIPSVISILAKNHTLGIVTNAPKKAVTDFLSRNNLATSFAFVDSSIDLFGKHRRLNKYHPDFYIGDMVRDIVAAQKVGCKSVGVTWGFESESILKAANPTFLAYTPPDLQKLLI